MDQMHDLSTECVLMLAPERADEPSRTPDHAVVAKDLPPADDEYGWAPVSLLAGDSFSSLVAGLFDASGDSSDRGSRMITIDSFPLVFDEEDPLADSSEIEYNVVVDAMDGSEYMITATDNLPANSDPVSYILESLPVELASISRLIHGDVVPASARAPPSDHPCGEEMRTVCASARGPDATISCLKAHFAQLSPRCKCALHHLLGDSLEDALDGPSKRLAPPELRSVPAMLPSDADGADMHIYGRHAVHGSCMLMPIVMLFLLILTARGIAACCRTPRHPEMMVVLPSEPAQISKGGVEPLLISQVRREYIDAIPSDAIPVAKV
jgi:hypothetical protein